MLLANSSCGRGDGTGKGRPGKQPPEPGLLVEVAVKPSPDPAHTWGPRLSTLLLSQTSLRQQPIHG